MVDRYSTSKGGSLEHVEKALPKELKDLIEKPMSGTSKKQGAAAMAEAHAQPVVVLRRLWERMSVLYPYRWTSTNGETPEDGNGTLTVAGDTWARGLAGLAPAEVGHAVNACMADPGEWPPGPQRFKALALGIPSFPSIQSEFSKTGHQASSLFAVMVWQELDAYRYRRADMIAADRMLRQAYDTATERRMRGEPLPAPPSGALQAPQEPTKKPADPEEVRKHLAKVAAELGLAEPVENVQEPQEAPTSEDPQP